MDGSLTRVIYNPASGGGKNDPQKLRVELENLQLDWVITKQPGDALRAAREWNKGLLIVAGGDGTINEAVNGLGMAGFPEDVTLALLPFGTGNDFARTLAIPKDPELALAIIDKSRTRRLDVVHVLSHGLGERFFINVANGGMGAEISATADKELKSRWGQMAYLRASLEVAQGFEVREVSLTLDGELHQLRIVNITVGNCRYVGGGWPAAPRANPEDGFLDLVVIEDISLPELLALAPKALLSADYLQNEGIFFARASTIEVNSDSPKLEFTVDGEVIGDEPAKFSVIPRALKVITGPDYTPKL